MHFVDLAHPKSWVLDALGHHICRCPWNCGRRSDGTREGEHGGVMVEPAKWRAIYRNMSWSGLTSLKICFRNMFQIVEGCSVGLADMLISVHNCRCGNRRISMILTTKSKDWSLHGLWDFSRSNVHEGWWLGHQGNKLLMSIVINQVGLEHFFMEFVASQNPQFEKQSAARSTGLHRSQTRVPMMFHTPYGEIISHEMPWSKNIRKSVQRSILWNHGGTDQTRWIDRLTLSQQPFPETKGWITAGWNQRFGNHYKISQVVGGGRIQSTAWTWIIYDLAFACETLESSVGRDMLRMTCRTLFEPPQTYSTMS